MIFYVQILPFLFLNFKRSYVQNKNVAGIVISQKQPLISEFSCMRKETVDIDILGMVKVMQSIRIMSRPTSRNKNWNQLSQFR